MSRGIKDLRELICVSRLTYHESDEELNYSDEEGRASRLSMLGQRLEVLSFDSGTDSRQSSAQSREAEPGTPDSGISTNGHAKEAIEELAAAIIPPQPPSERRLHQNKKHRRKKANKIPAKDLLTLHELPTTAPLPPVTIDSRPTSSSGESSSTLSISNVRRIGGAKGPRVGPARTTSRTNYDGILSYLDASIVGEWLEHANANISNLVQWTHHKDNFVHFAHFWLSQFSDLRKQEIFQLEHSIVLDHLELSFAAGIDAGKVKHKDLIEFLSAVFREYPGRVLSTKGAHMFLDYLDILTSERTKAYKTLLSDVRCSTRNRQYAQLVLAVRCFTLASVWNAVISFYCRLVGEANKNTVDLPDLSKLKPNNQRMYLAVRYVDVVAAHMLHV